MPVGVKGSDERDDAVAGEPVHESATRRSGAGAVSDPLALADTLARNANSDGGLAPGTMLEGAYRIEKEIGRGGMGAVYLAEHVTLGRRFAVKIVGEQEQINPEAVARLIQEARTASSIEHENIVDVTHLGTDPDTGLVFVVMELLRGHDLRGRLEEHLDSGGDAWLPDEETRDLAEQILSALAAAHAAGIVHRDLKPENVFLATKRRGVQVKVVDFGMSKLSANESSVKLTKTGQMIGTPLYMSPEQSQDGGEADARADVYSLGVMLYEMLAGEVPFPVDTVYACILAHATKPPPPLGPRRPGLPEPVVDVVMRCLEKEPDDRFVDASALLEAWGEAWEGRFTVPPPTSSDEMRVDSGVQDAVAAAVQADVADAARADSRETVSIAPVAAPKGSSARIVGGMLVVMLAGGGWWAWTQSQSPSIPPAESPPRAVVVSPSPDPEPPAAAPVEAAMPVGVDLPTPPAAPAVRTIEITSTPPGAEVRDGDAVLGETPLSLEVAEGASARSLTLHLRGRRPATIELSESSPDRVETSLSRRARPSSSSADTDLAGW